MPDERIKELREQIEKLEAQWPAHSVPAAMLEQLDDLEEELAAELAKQAGESEKSGGGE